MTKRDVRELAEPGMTVQPDGSQLIDPGLRIKWTKAMRQHKRVS